MTMEPTTCLKPNIGRLRKLADHLEHGEKLHDEFNLEMISGVRRVGEDQAERTCGCAIGEFPAVWPNAFVLDVVWINSVPHRDPHPGAESSFRMVENWLSIDETIGWLFFTLGMTGAGRSRIRKVTDKQFPVLWGRLVGLNKYSTAEDVAYNIRVFCDYWEAQNWPVTVTKD